MTARQIIYKQMEKMVREYPPWWKPRLRQRYRGAILALIFAIEIIDAKE